MANPRQANGAARRRLVHRLKAEHRDCWICRAFGRPSTIDYSLPYLDPGAFTCDELKPVSKWQEYGYRSATEAALDYGNVDAAHRACNNWRKNRPVEWVLAEAAKAREHKDSLPKPFKDW